MLFGGFIRFHWHLTWAVVSPEESMPCAGAMLPTTTVRAPKKVHSTCRVESFGSEMLGKDVKMQGARHGKHSWTRTWDNNFSSRQLWTAVSIHFVGPWRPTWTPQDSKEFQYVTRPEDNPPRQGDDAISLLLAIPLPLLFFGAICFGIKTLSLLSHLLI